MRTERGLDRLVNFLLASSASLSWLTEHIKRTPAIRAGDADEVHAGPVWVTTSLFAVILLVVVVTPIGMGAMFLLFLDGPIEGLLKRRRRPVPQPVP